MSPPHIALHPSSVRNSESFFLPLPLLDSPFLLFRCPKLDRKGRLFPLATFALPNCFLAPFPSPPPSFSFPFPASHCGISISILPRLPAPPPPLDPPQAGKSETGALCEPGEALFPAEKEGRQSHQTGEKGASVGLVSFSTSCCC